MITYKQYNSSTHYRTGTIWLQPWQYRYLKLFIYQLGGNRDQPPGYFRHRDERVVLFHDPNRFLAKLAPGPEGLFTLAAATLSLRHPHVIGHGSGHRHPYRRLALRQQYYTYWRAKLSNSKPWELKKLKTVASYEGRLVPVTFTRRVATSSRLIVARNKVPIRTLFWLQFYVDCFLKPWGVDIAPLGAELCEVLAKKKPIPNTQR